MKVEDCMTKKVVSIPGNLSLNETIHQFCSQTIGHQGYPVVNEFGRVMGVVTTDEILEKANASTDESLFQIKDCISKRTLIVAYPKESCRVAAERMALYDVGRLPVVSKENPNELIGIITRSDLLKARLYVYDEENSKSKFINLRII